MNDYEDKSPLFSISIPSFIGHTPLVMPDLIRHPFLNHHHNLILKGNIYIEMGPGSKSGVMVEGLIIWVFLVLPQAPALEAS